MSEAKSEVMSDEQIIENWERSGLLEDAVSKKDLAMALQMAGAMLLEVARKNEDAAAGAAQYVFPILTRSLNYRKFQFTNWSRMLTTNFGNTELIKVRYPVKNADVDYLDEDLSVCKSATTELRELLSKYNNLVVDSVFVTLNDNHFELGLRCHEG
jgi:hypothetical protein